MSTRTTDYIQQLANYIRKNLNKGYTLDSLKFALQDQGYSRSSIDRAIELANEQLSKLAPKMIEKPVIKFERVPLTQEGEESSEEKVTIKKKSWLAKLFNNND